MLLMKRLILLGLACVSTLALAVSAGDGPGTYAATAPLQLVPGEALQSLSLPWAVVQASRSNDLANVRVFDAQGRPLPMAWAQTPSAAERTRVVQLPVFAWPESSTTEPAPVRLHLNTNGTVLDLQTSASNSAARPLGSTRAWLIDLSALMKASDERGESLRLEWPASATGLSAQASLERSEDGQEWQTLTSGRLLEFPASTPDDKAQTPPRIDSLAWPASSERLPRYVRLRLDTPLALSGASVSLTHSLAPAALTQVLRFEPVSGTKSEAQWLLDLQARLAPQAIGIDLPAGNTLLNLRLEQRNESTEPWRIVSRFVAWRMQRGGVDGQAPAQPVNAAPARYWRLVAEGPVPSSLQAQDLTVRWHWQAPRLVLLAQGEPGFTLAVGRAGQQPAALPLNTVMPGYESGAEFKLPQASLGELQFRPAKDFAEQLASPEPEALRRWALWAVLIVAVCGLAWMARGLLRKIGPPDNS